MYYEIRSDISKHEAKQTMKKIIIVLAFTWLMSACATTKKSSNKSKKGGATVSLDMDSLIAANLVNKKIVQEPYQAAADKIFDLVHTKLNVRFDYKKRYMYGEAAITLKSHFYPHNQLLLDAKGMDILGITINGAALKYTYDSLQLQIELDKKYKKDENFTLTIRYVAKPDELPDPAGSAAITSDKGLYFINPDGTDPEKPTQIWTQGETEAASCWFPTIDKPNQKTTEEIYITVPAKYTTLSNGTLMSSKANADGTRTDYWKQDLPHAPYLFMMAIGEFAVYKDTWRDKEVAYYVEKKYAPYARNIFGNAPEMIEFFSSKITGVAYPWDKFSNIIVRDYVSGAMENTGAVIYMDALQQTSREQLDNDYETIIAHELFHHWFGDLVTCESWSNLSLNESFANYSEYLWLEYKYGREQADYENIAATAGYMRDAQNKKKKLIRFNYSNKEEMFDGHSYNKGGRILHMLRTELGDDAFYGGLNVYLTKNKFKSAEVHDLRLAFEEVSGRDLNWFFNQWYFEAGHPVLSYNYGYDEVTREATVEVTQKQMSAGDIAFRLPLAVDVYTDGKAQRHEIVVSNEVELFRFPCASMPDFINADARKTTLCKKNENKTIEQFIKQYQQAPLYNDRYEALQGIADKVDNNKDVNKVFYTALIDKHYSLRKNAIEKINLDDPNITLAAYPIIERIAINDTKSTLRAAAIKKLKDNNADAYESLFFQSLNDSSYVVVAAALKAINKINKTKGATQARNLFKEDNAGLAAAIMQLLAEPETVAVSDFAYFDTWANKNAGFVKMSILNQYVNYTIKTKDATIIDKAIATLDKGWNSNDVFWMNGSYSSGLDKIKKYCKDALLLDKAATIDAIIAKHKAKN